MTAVLAYTSGTAARQGWDEVDRTLLGVLRRGPATLTDLAESTDYSAPIVKDAVLGYLRSGLATVVLDHGYRYELTLAGWARLAQLSGRAAVPAMRQAA